MADIRIDMEVTDDSAVTMLLQTYLTGYLKALKAVRADIPAHVLHQMMYGDLANFVELWETKFDIGNTDNDSYWVDQRDTGKRLIELVVKSQGNG